MPLHAIFMQRTTITVEWTYAVVRRHLTNYAQLLEAIKGVPSPTSDAINGVRNNNVILEHDGSLPLVDQLSFFASADAVIGPHGAAFSHIIMMRRGAGVVEFLAAGDSMKLLYMCIALKMELQYRGVVTPGSTHLSAFNVDVAEGVHALNDVLREKIYITQLSNGGASH